MIQGSSRASRRSSRYEFKSISLSINTINIKFNVDKVYKNRLMKNFSHQLTEMEKNNKKPSIFFSSSSFPFITQARKRQREEADSGGGVGGASVISVDMIGGGASASASSSTAASRAELINERIGYKPHPKPATLPTLFGSLQF